MGDDEKDRLLRTYPPGSAPIYSGHAVVGTPSTILEPPNQYKSRWRSIRVMYLTMFLSSVSFSICMSSIWPYLQLLDSNANTDFLGWVVASYSVGQLIASPLFGAWASCRNKSREPLVVSMLINVVANVLYSYLESLPSNKAVALIVARTLVGFGAGNVAVVRSYVSGATTLKERTAAMATMSAFQAVGFIIGPVIQIAMVPIGYPGPVHIESLHLDLYTSPAILSALVGIMNIILLFAVFREHHVDNDEDMNFSVQEGGSSLERSVIPDYKPDALAVISSIALFFVILFIFAVFETIGTPLTMHMYSWTKSNATLYNGIILGVGGFVSIVVFIGIRILSKRVNERYILLGGFIMCLLGFFVYLPWGSQYPSYQTATIGPVETPPPNSTSTTRVPTSTSWTTTDLSSFITQSNSAYATELAETSSNSQNNSTQSDIPQSDTEILYFESSHMEDLEQSDYNYLSTLSPHNLTTTEKHKNSSKEAEAVGCPDSYKWCSYTPIVTFAQFVMGCLLICIGYPTCNVMTYTLYSKILGPKPQGLTFYNRRKLFSFLFINLNVVPGIMMGWLTASGSLARTVGPIFVSQVYNAYGPRVTFVAMIIFIFLAILMFISVFKRLVPFKFSAEVKAPV